MTARSAAFWMVAAMFAACCAAAEAKPPVAGFLEGLLAIPSVSSDTDANNEAVRYVKDWLDARGVCTATVTNEAGRAALYASTTPGKEHDVVFVTHLDGGCGVRLDCHSKLPQVRQTKLGRTNSGRSYIVKKSTYD